jgi:hypothetical protein
MVLKSINVLLYKKLVVDKKRIIGKNGGRRRRKGTRDL